MPNTAPEAHKQLHVVVGVLRDAKQQVLIARRHNQQHLGGLWEFPGGKVEPFESPREALKRELVEELGIGVVAARPLLRIPHHYPTKSVLLDVWHIDRFTGEPEGREGQPLRWVAPQALAEVPFPQANKPIVDRLRLPAEAVVVGVWHGLDDLLARLDRSLLCGPRLVYLRELPQAGAEEVVARAAALCRQYHSPLVVNDIRIAKGIAGVGVHLKSRHLSIDAAELTGLPLVGGSAHNEQELQACKILQLNYAFVSPVFKTSSHPDAIPLGVADFATTVAHVGLPIYGLGGMTKADSGWVQSVGGQGVASLSAFWQ